MQRLLIVIPVLNEQEALRTLIDEVLRAIDADQFEVCEPAKPQ